MADIQASLEALGQADLSDKADPLKQLAARQQEMYDRLNEIMSQMEKLESIQELARRVSYIIDICQEVKQGIRAIREQTSNVFDPTPRTTQPAPPSGTPGGSP